MKKRYKILMVFVALLFALSACTAASEEEKVKIDGQAVESVVFTLEELAKYNGKNDMPAYVGYEGNVYDVSNIKAWEKGVHQGQYEAGQDLTDILNNVAPHASSRLTDNAPLVGTLEKK